MPRYIDADALMKDGWVLHKEVVRMGVYAMRKMPLSCPSLPTVDAVPVVRCSECKRSDWYESADGRRYAYCMEMSKGGLTAEDYCSFGEREDGDSDG